METLRLFRRNPAFIDLWLARLLSFFSDTLVTTAFILSLDGSEGGEAWVGLLLAAQTVPRLLGPLFGSLVDLTEQRRLMIASGAAKVLIFVAILFVPGDRLLVTLMVAAATVFSTLLSISGRSVLPAVVAQSDLPPANALLGLGLNASLAFGPAAAGLLFDRLGLPGLLILAIAVFLLAILLTGRLPYLPTSQETVAARAGFVQATRAGVGFLARHATARAVALGLTLTVVFAALENVALVFLVQDVLGASPALFGLVSSAFGVGMVLAPLLFLPRVAKISPRWVLLAGVSLLGGGLLLTGLAPAVILVIFTHGLSGMGNGLQNLANDTLIQQTVPRPLLGRMFGSVYSGAHLAAALAYLVGGPFLALTSPRFVFVSAGAAVLASMLVLQALLPKEVGEKGERAGLRIGYHGFLEPDVHTLRALHRAHLLAVPFENLDIHLGHPIVLEEARLFDKIVTLGRGGFCYELNGLFSALLRDLGFRVQRLAARVADDSGGFGLEFDHMTLLVELNERWLADVGFGDSFREPLRLDERGEQAQGSGRYRIAAGGDGLVLLQDDGGIWKPQYTFTLQPYGLSDFAETCRYHQTSPDSTFTQRRVCTRATPVGRITLSERKLIVKKNGSRQERLLESECEVYTALRDHFGIVLEKATWKPAR